MEVHLKIFITFFSKNSPLKGATAISCTTGTSLLPTILNLKIKGIPFGMPTLQYRFIESLD